MAQPDPLSHSPPDPHSCAPPRAPTTPLVVAATVRRARVLHKKQHTLPLQQTSERYGTQISRHMPGGPSSLSCMLASPPRLRTSDATAPCEHLHTLLSQVVSSKVHAGHQSTAGISKRCCCGGSFKRSVAGAACPEPVHRPPPTFCLSTGITPHAGPCMAPVPRLRMQLLSCQGQLRCLLTR